MMVPSSLHLYKSNTASSYALMKFLDFIQRSGYRAHAFIIDSWPGPEKYRLPWVHSELGLLEGKWKLSSSTRRWLQDCGFQVTRKYQFKILFKPYLQCRSGSRRRVPRSTATKGRILTGIVSSLTWSRWCQSALIWERMEPSKLSTRTLSGSLLLLIKWHTRAMGRPLGKNLSVSWSVSQSVTGTFIFSQGDRGKAKPYYQSPTYASSMICKFFYSVEKSGFVVKW